MGEASELDELVFPRALLLIRDDRIIELLVSIFVVV